MRRFFLGAAAIAAMSLTIIAPAHADWRWHHGPRGWVRFWAPGVVVGAPVYVAPPPVYYAPPPPPVYYAPPPVVYAPPIVSFGIHIR